MDKSRINNILSSIAMAVVNDLVSRDNGIGNNPDNKQITINDINSLYSLRKTIINENIVLVLKDKNYDISDSSFLLSISDNDLDNKTFGDIPSSIANVLESELLNVKNVVIPEINSLAEEFEKRTINITTPANSGTLYKIAFFKNSSILRLLNGTDLNGHENDAGATLSNLSVSFPAIDDFAIIKNKIKTNNPIVDSAIDSLLETKTPDYWLSLYNDVFGALSNDRFTKQAIEKTRYVDDNIFCYLVSKAIANNSFGFTINGTEVEYKNTVETLVYHFRQVLARTVAYINNTSDTLWELDSDKDAVIIRKDSMGDLDVDTIIGAVLLGIYKTEDVLANRDDCKNECVKAIDLANIQKRKTFEESIRNSYMDISLEYILPITANQEYNDVRKTISNVVYSLSDKALLDTKKVFRDILLEFKYKNTNVKYILERMSFYLCSLDKTDDVYNNVAEYVALELVSKYLVNTHLVIEE